MPHTVIPQFHGFEYSPHITVPRFIWCIEAFVLALSDELSKRGNRPKVLFKMVDGFDLKDNLREATLKRPYPIHFTKRGDLRVIAQHVSQTDIIHGHNPN